MSYEICSLNNIDLPFQNSGRISYFISRKTGLRVTDLVQPLLRVADPKIATLKGRILQGKSMGRTDVQVKRYNKIYQYIFKNIKLT